MKQAKKGEYLFLKDGIIMDGTGKPGEIGSVLLNGPVIEKVFRGKAMARGKVIDCTGSVIAPGFIDAHSHMDWFMVTRNGDRYRSPFTEQGITTFMGGNCGFSPAGIKEDMDPAFAKAVCDNIFKEGLQGKGIPWRTMDQYFRYCRTAGLSHNLASFVGHGCVRASIKGFDPSPLSADEQREMASLIEMAMEQGARGVSFGLQYEPGLFATMDELEDIARLVKKHDKMITVHMKALSALSAEYPMKPFGTPHNLIALREILDIARRTGVRLQVSHLIFVGKKTWPTCDDALAMIDRAIDDGVDVMFDTYSYSCGASIINVLLPAWFLANIPANYRSRKALLRLKLELTVIKRILGLGIEDLQIIRSNNAELSRFNGLFMDRIARERGMNEIENLVDFSERSDGRASIILHKYSNPGIIKKLMRHRASLFMTDAWVEPGDHQNPAAYGCFPRFLQIARDEKTLSIEEAVRKMTGAVADRMRLDGRGYIREKMSADITIFAPGRIRDNNTPERGNMRPDGIEAVFINGVRALHKGVAAEKCTPGKIL